MGLTTLGRVMLGRRGPDMVGEGGQAGPGLYAGNGTELGLVTMGGLELDGRPIESQSLSISMPPREL